MGGTRKQFTYFELATQGLGLPVQLRAVVAGLVDEATTSPDPTIVVGAEKPDRKLTKLVIQSLYIRRNFVRMFDLSRPPAGNSVVWELIAIHLILTYSQHFMQVFLAKISSVLPNQISIG